MCTGVRLACADGTVVRGRTAEFAVELGLSVNHVPAGLSFTSALSHGAGASWTTARSVVGVACFGKEAVLDGMNDAGLSAGAFYFSGFAEYPEDDGGSDAVAPQDFVHWVLTTCRSTDQVRDTIGGIRVVGSTAAEWGGVPPFHYVVYDPDGRCIVIEPRDGELVVSDNPYGSITNSPEFDFHLKNLAQYIKVGPETIGQATIGGGHITGFGSGTGALGLPGDFTSPSRFVRATMFSVYHETPRTCADGVQEVFHLLNHFDVPRGFVTVAEKGTDHIEWTLATVASDPSTASYYYRTYGDQSLRRVNLRLLDEANRSRVLRLPAGPSTGDTTVVFDMNQDLLGSAPAPSGTPS